MNPLWKSPELEKAYRLLEEELDATHPEHGEHDIIKIALDAVEYADCAIERMSNLRRGLPAEGALKDVAP